MSISINVSCGARTRHEPDGTAVLEVSGTTAWLVDWAESYGNGLESVRVSDSSTPSVLGVRISGELGVIKRIAALVLEKARRAGVGFEADGQASISDTPAPAITLPPYHMTGPEHYLEAERLANEARAQADSEVPLPGNRMTAPSGIAAVTMAEATMHATLALTAATVLNVRRNGAIPALEREELSVWAEII